MRIVGAAEGSIIPVIMTAHIPQRRNRCGASQEGVIIHRLAPSMGPYMSRARMTIQAQDAMGSARSNMAMVVRSDRRADSRRVGGRSE
jgi:hypothetical protein